jgi:hypothetical protein
MMEVGSIHKIESSGKQILRARICVFLRVSLEFVYANVLM